jgi:myo-inositol-1(or 4)-monophosphatase
MTIEARLTFATQLILEAGQLMARHFAHRETLTRESKGPQDFVSIADREVESLIRSRLAEAFPTDGFLGEESGGEVGGAVLGRRPDRRH